MGFSSQPRTSHKYAVPLLLAAAVYVAVLASAGLWRMDGAAASAVAQEEICRELLGNTTAGRQALVSSVWQAPLPVLLRLPLVAVFNYPPCPVASVLLSALFGAAVLLLLDHWFRLWRLGKIRFLLLAALAGNPIFIREGMTGSSTPMIFFFMLLSVYGLLAWFQERHVRHLVYLAFCGALLAGMSVEVFCWQLTLFLLLLLDMRLHVVARAQKEAVVILAVLPAVYLAGVWVLMNWLIMGDPWYFLRSLRMTGLDRGSFLAGSWGFDTLEVWAAGLCLLCALRGVVKRDLTGITLGVMGLMPLGLGQMLALRGWLWARTPLLFGVFLLAVAATGYVVVKMAAFSGKIRVLACLLPVALSLAVWMTQAPASATSSERDLRTVVAERQQWLPQIERHVRKKSDYPKVFVCGYESFLLAGGQTGGVFEIALDFNFFKVRNDYHGHNLFLLVHRPSGRSALDSIHWKYDRVYYLGGSGTLYEGDWGDWRLFEIIEAPQ